MFSVADFAHILIIFDYCFHTAKNTRCSTKINNKKSRSLLQKIITELSKVQKSLEHFYIEHYLFNPTK